MFIDSYRIIESYQSFLLLHFRHIEWYNKLWCLRSSIRIGLPRGSPKFSGATPCPVSRWLSKFGAQNGAPGSPRKTNAENRVLPVMWRIMAFQVLSTQGSWGLEKAGFSTPISTPSWWFGSVYHVHSLVSIHAILQRTLTQSYYILYIYNIYKYILRCLNIWNVPLDPLHQNLPKASMYSVRPVLKTPDNLTSSALIIRTPP